MDLYERYVSLWPKDQEVALRGGLIENSLNADAGINPDISYLESMMLNDTNRYLTDDILVKVDRSAMAVSLETRVPFLDSDVFKFAWSLPLEMKIDRGEGR